MHHLNFRDVIFAKEAHEHYMRWEKNKNPTTCMKQNFAAHQSWNPLRAPCQTSAWTLPGRPRSGCSPVPSPGPSYGTWSSSCSSWPWWLCRGNTSEWVKPWIQHANTRRLVWKRLLLALIGFQPVQIFKCTNRGAAVGKKQKKKKKLNLGQAHSDFFSATICSTICIKRHFSFL